MPSSLLSREFAGLAGGIFLDVIGILKAIFPAVFSLLGRSTRWFSSWLDRMLPNFACEGFDQPESIFDSRPSGSEERMKILDPAH